MQEKLRKETVRGADRACMFVVPALFKDAYVVVRLNSYTPLPAGIMVRRHRTVNTVCEVQTACGAAFVPREEVFLSWTVYSKHFARHKRGTELFKA